MICHLILVLSLAAVTYADSVNFVPRGNEPRSMYDPQSIYEPQIDLMGGKTPHLKSDDAELKEKPKKEDAWAPFDFTKFDAYMQNTFAPAEDPREDPRDHNRIKRKAKRRRGRGRRRNKNKSTTPSTPEEGGKEEAKNGTKTEVPIARRGDKEHRQTKKGKKSKADTYDPRIKSFESNFVEMPKDLYQAHLRPGVIFRIHMSEAIIKMQYRTYGEDKDESVIEADVEYLRLTRKVINDEITKFEDLKWLIGWFSNRSELIQEHMCNVRYFTVGTPPTMFTHPEEYMKRMCLFDNVYIDHIPYVVGEDNSLMAAVAPPVLHCDAATCTSVPFIDSIMFDERLPRTNVRTVTRCQASCRAHCRNDPDCLKRCSDRCLRAEKK